MIDDPDVILRALIEVGVLNAEHVDDALHRQFAAAGFDPDAVLPVIVEHVVRVVTPGHAPWEYLGEGDDALERWRLSTGSTLLHGILVGLRLAAAREAVS